MGLTLAIGAIAAGSAYAAHLLADIRLCIIIVPLIAVTNATVGVTLLPLYGIYALALTVCVTVGMLAHHILADRDSPLSTGGQR